MMRNEQIKRALRIAVIVGAGFEGGTDDARDILELITTLETENAELRENADIVKHCGFEVIIEEATEQYPARKVLHGVDGCTYVPGFPEVTE